MIVPIPHGADPRSPAMLHRINAALTKPGSTLPAQGLAPQVIVDAWTAESLGEAIKRAIAAGHDWTSTAEHLAGAMSLKLEDAR